MRYKAVFFDLDGTLMDTSDGVFAGGVYAMREQGQVISDSANWDVFIGPPLGDCFRLTFGITDDDLIKRLCQSYHDFYEKEGQFRAKFYPGILDVVGELKKRGYILGIASMKNQDMVQSMCHHFGVDCFFTEQVGIDLVGTMTKADLLSAAFKHLHLSAKDCVLIGDTELDVQGAMGAGCDCIRVNWGFGFKSGTPGTISHPSEILALV